MSSEAPQYSQWSSHSSAKLQPQFRRYRHRLWAALNGRWVSRDPPKTLETRLMRALAAPLAPLLMIILATPVAGGTPRSGGIPGGMGLGLAAGLSYLLLDGILGVLGEAGSLPPLLAAWLPHAAFACIGGAMLLYVEG